MRMIRGERREIEEEIANRILSDISEVGSDDDEREACGFFVRLLLVLTHLAILGLLFCVSFSFTHTTHEF